MMLPDVETLAGRMYAARAAGFRKEYGGEEWRGWDECGEGQKDYWRKLAKAAIAAIETHVG